MTKPVSMNFEMATRLELDFGPDTVIAEIQSPLLMDNPAPDVEPYTVHNANVKKGDSNEPGFSDHDIFVARMAARGDISARVISIMREDVT